VTKKFRNYFLVKYTDESDAFEYARALMLYRFCITFFVIYFLPLVVFVTNDIEKGVIKTFLDLFFIIAMPFLIRYSARLDRVINFFFLLAFLSLLSGLMMFTPEKLETYEVIWCMFFLALSALIQRGIGRIFYCCFLGWLPMTYVLINIQLKGTLSWNLIIENNAAEPPLILIAIPISLIIYAIWSQTNTIQKAKDIILGQRQLIHQKNKNITDSIIYAKRIQQAKLADIDEVYKIFPKCFILFKPKDIVSGDFYYFNKNKTGIIIGSADCTGHGVPGALMSMLAMEKIDEALAHSTDLSEILSLLNRGIKSSLKQTHSEASTHDGLDIALCSIDLPNNILKFAGANRPIWIIRSGKTEVEEIKPTKKAIGGFTEDGQCFNTHEIKLNQDDTFYLFSDGYADTFGGPNGKKMTSKKFKELLISIQHLSLQDQENHLDNFVETWKAGIEQTDDILVIGVRM
jgi:serine phosphatase RsbU (regulator of sigma subunit)